MSRFSKVLWIDLISSIKVVSVIIIPLNMNGPSFTGSHLGGLSSKLAGGVLMGFLSGIVINIPRVIVPTIIRIHLSTHF
nr:MAG TPA: hypothetical protein [Caudoviricetes sp.]